MSIVYGDEKLAVRTEAITGAVTLTASDSGKYFTLAGATGALITLPAVTIAGWKARFTVGALFATSNWVLRSTTNVINGAIDVNSTLVPAGNENSINFVATADTIGDYVEVYSDGTNFYVYGFGTLAGSITATVV